MMFVLEAPPAVFLLDLHVKVLGPSIESMWLEEICWSILNFRTFSVSDISREANKGAVVLAKLDLASGRPRCGPVIRCTWSIG